MSDTIRTDKLNTNKLTVTGLTSITGPFCIKKGVNNHTAVFDAPVCLNDEVKGLINCLNIQEAGNPVTGTPHKTINFTGDGVNAVDAGNGIADITFTSGSSNCIVQEDTEVCVIDTNAPVGGEYPGTNARIHMVVDNEFFLTMYSNGALKHGSNPFDDNAPNSLTSGGPFEFDAMNPAPRATGLCSQAFGAGSLAMGRASHAEGFNTSAEGTASHAEGRSTTAEGRASYAEGFNTQARGDYSHAEGRSCIATGEASHAEGIQCFPNGNYSHAEGNDTTANGIASHAEGGGTSADGHYSHAQGLLCRSSGEHSHAGGSYSNALNYGQWAHSGGQFSAVPGAIGSGATGTGDAQHCIYVLRNACPASATTTLYLDGQTQNQTLVIPTSGTVCFTGKVIARSYDGNRDDDDVIGWLIEGVIDRESASDSIGYNVILRGDSVTPIYDSSNDVSIALTLGDANGANPHLEIEVTTGSVASIWHVVATVETIEVRSNSTRVDIIV